MTEATKTNPAPLDAYETAKPDEPIFTLQGGDPLAAPLVRIWAYLARVRCGFTGDVSMIDAPIYVAKITSVEHDSEECRNLLIRATQAEQVSWYMDGYRRGEINLTAELASVDDLEKLDTYDIRRRFVSRLQNSIGEILDFTEELIDRGFLESRKQSENAVAMLKALNELVEIRREN